MLEKEVLNFEKTVIVGIVTQSQSEEKLTEYLDELEFLTFTAGGQVVKRFWQKMDKPNPKTFLGTGKIDEINLYVRENGVSTVIFDDELSPSQQKNISRIIDCKILDRTNLILASLTSDSKFASLSVSVLIPKKEPSEYLREYVIALPTSCIFVFDTKIGNLPLVSTSHFRELRCFLHMEFHFLNLTVVESKRTCRAF